MGKRFGIVPLPYQCITLGELGVVQARYQLRARPPLALDRFELAVDPVGVLCEYIQINDSCIH